MTPIFAFLCRPNGRSAEAKATELLHLYIYDYCKKKKFVQAARAFSSEANVPTDQVPPFESSTGFLADWWSVFWDIYFAKSKEAEASKEANIMDEVNQRGFDLHSVCILMNVILVSQLFAHQERRGATTTTSV